MRKLLLTIAVVFLLAGTVYAEGTSVKDMQTDVTVASDGACQVVLTCQMAFSGEESFTLPIAYEAKNITVSGAEFTRRRENGTTLLTLQGTQSGEKQLVISYHLAETVVDKGDSQDFAVTLLYPAWTCPIERYHFTVTLPAEFEGYPTVLSGYYGDLIDNYMEFQIQDGVIHAELNPKQTLQDHESMTLQLTLPESYFDLRFLAGKTTQVDNMVMLMMLGLCVVYWVIFIRGPLVIPKRQAMPPVGGNAGDIPYVLTGGKADLALMVIQWATLGYLSIHRVRKKGLYLQREIDMGNECKPHEIAIFKTLFRRGDHCDVRSAEYVQARQDAASRTKDQLEEKIFSPHGASVGLLHLGGVLAGLSLCLGMLDLYVAPQSWRWFVIVPLTLLGALASFLVQRLGGCTLRRHTLRAMVLGLLGAVYLVVLGRLSGSGRLTALNLAAQLAIGLATRLGGKRSRPGTAQAQELLGFRRYLLATPSEHFRALLAADGQYFYRILPYADALRVAKLFVGAFDRQRVEPCDWLAWEGKTPKTVAGFYALYLRLTALLRGERPPRARRRR